MLDEWFENAFHEEMMSSLIFIQHHSKKFSEGENSDNIKIRISNFK